MKFLILAENSRSQYLHYHYRNTAANELRRRINLAGYEAEIIEWIRHWDKNDLKKIIDCYFKDEPNPVIAVSSTFDLDNSDLKYLTDIFQYAKDKISNLKIIHGGNRVFYPEDYNGLVDIEFLGRSMGIFDDWIRGKAVSQYKVHDFPLILTNHNISRFIDNPIIYNVNDNDCLNKNDFLGFEIGVGCRFNCSFCNYELRNAKTVVLNDSYQLHHMFDEAYNKYGVTNFYAIDDTINESEEKLETLVKAIEKLNYHPKITAWARLDLLNKQYQRDYFKRINFSGLWFGIESFNPEASKNVRKKSSLDNVFPNLEFMRDECPDTFKTGSFIIGLYGDNLESIENGFEKAHNEKLLDALQIFSLTLNPAPIQDSYLQSELEKDPEKFGYKIYNKEYAYDSRLLSTQIFWESDWTNNVESTKMTDRLIKKYGKKFLMLSHSECASFKAMNLIKPDQKRADTHILKSKGLILANAYKQDYIARKKAKLGYF